MDETKTAAERPPAPAGTPASLDRPDYPRWALAHAQRARLALSSLLDLGPSTAETLALAAIAEALTSIAFSELQPPRRTPSGFRNVDLTAPR